MPLAVIVLDVLLCVIVVIVLILFFNLFLPMILDAFGVFDVDYTKVEEEAVRHLLGIPS